MPEQQGSHEQSGVFAARLLVPQERATLPQLIAAAKERAPDPAMFDSHEPIFWTVEASNNNLDAYSTYMGTDTLQNFAADAKRGVSFQDGHLTDGMARTLGQSIGSRYIGPGAAARPEGVAAVEADFFTFRNLDPNIDSFVNKAMAGLIRDVSVGFYGGWYRCTICDRDMQDYSDWENYCPHIPGMRYPLFDEKGKATDERVTAAAEIKDAHLAEVSGVYDGATPDASILVIKARDLADAGKLDRDVTQFISRRYHIRLPGAARTFVGASIAKEAEVTKRTVPQVDDEQAEERAEEVEETTNQRAEETEETTEEVTPEQVEERKVGRMAVTRALATLRGPLAEACRAAGITAPEGDDLLPHIRALATVVQERGAEIARLTPLAKDGETFRATLVDETLSEGVRAYGKDFAEATYRALLATAPIETVQQFKKDWRSLANAIFKPGRDTINGDEADTRAPKERNANGGQQIAEPPVPMSAFRAGR